MKPWQSRAWSAWLAGVRRCRESPIPWVVAGCCLVMLWAYGPTLGAMVRRWWQDPQYSHGFLVPLFALALLRRGPGVKVAFRPSWWGVPILAAGAALRLSGAFVYLDWLDAASFLVSLAGGVVLFGGGPAWRRCWPALAFLLFMLPLPFQLEIALSQPLQRLAVGASTYCLQTLGLPALAQGNVIVIDDLKLGVLEACNGLSMLLSFFTLATAVALVIRRPLATRLLVVASAVPVALILNIARITATGVLHRTAGSAVANAVFHDLAGWLMMPLALGLLWLELLLLARLWIPLERTGPVPVLSPRTGGLPALRTPSQTRRHGRAAPACPAGRPGGPGDSSDVAC